jgi:hypothetical protein
MLGSMAHIAHIILIIFNALKIFTKEAAYAGQAGTSGRVLAR